MSLLPSIFLCLVNIVIYASAQSEGLYTVVAPGTIRPNSDFTVIASVHKSQVPAKIKVSIDGPDFSKDETVDVQPFSYETITFQIPSIKEGTYNVTAEGLDGIIFKNVSTLEYSKFDSFVLVQTDKATYKPGDLVRFRILILGKETRPAKIEGPVAVSISDPQQNIIKQVNKAEFTKGVYSDELQLSQFPNLGQWEILIKYGGESERSTFEVDKYVLPKFEVSIDSPKDVYKKDGKLKAIVRAKYTFGKPVKGEAVITVKEKWSYWRGEGAPAPVIKTAPLDGKASFEIDLTNDLKSDRDWDMTYELSASVEETLTGFKQTASADVTVHSQRYKIEGVNIPSNFIEDVPMKITVVVKNFDGSPVQDTANPIVITIEPERRWYPRPIPFNPDGTKTEEIKKEDDEKKKQEDLKNIVFEEKLDESGMATITFTPIKDMASFYSIRAKYLDKEDFVGSINKQESKSGSFFQLETLTEKPRLDREVSMKVESNQDLKYLFYQIIARGNIVEAGKIEVPDDRNYHVFKFQPTFDMVPSCNVFVYYIKDGEVVFAEKSVEIEQQLNNFIKINVPTQAKAGDEVELKVTTKPDSYVGLLGVDQSVLLLKSGNDLSKDDVINALHKFDTRTPWGSWDYGTKVPGRDSGVITMTNAAFPKVEVHIMPLYFSPGAGFGLVAERGDIMPLAGLPGIPGPPPPMRPAPIPQVEVRKKFPETWLWLSIENNENGEITIRNKVPDTITSWVLTGFSIHPESGLGLTSKPKKLQVFQPFFVSTNLPYSVKRGEVIAIPVVVFNYMDDNIKADVTLDNTHGEFEFVTPPGETKSETDAETQQTKAVEIESGSGVSKSFLVRPKRAGQMTLKISAMSPVSGDIVQQILRVDPEGVTQFVNKAVFLDLKDQNEQTQEISIEVPADVVPDSTYVEVSVVGDLLGPTIKNLDKLVRMPYGCGEQNMVNFVPNILVLRYLTRINKLTPAIESKAKNFLEIGYQRELTYKHDDGSYSAFGKNDKSGSTWLTAYVCRSFHEAQEFTNIDPKVIKQGLEFLAKNQAENGSFPETGKIIDHHHVDKSGKGLSLTGFTLLAFLENKEEIPNYQNNINKGLEYLVNNIDDETDIYSLAIAAYALQKAKHEKKDVILEKLNARQKKEGGHSWWADKEPEKKENQPHYWYEPQTSNTEITAYGLLAQLESGAGEETVPTLKWLVAQRNSNGGFSSTQDTVVGLQALIKFSEKYNVDRGNIEVSFSDDKGGSGAITVNDENAIVLQTHMLDPEAKLVKITGKGKGSTLVQVSYRYNVDKKDDSPRFTIKSEVKDSSKAELIELSVCTSFIPREDEKTSNMAVMEVSLPSGYIADEDNLKDIEKLDRVQKVETKNGESVVVIYFDDLDSTEVCPLIKGFRAHRVAEQKPSAIIVYDYYDNDRQARAFYEIKKISLNEI